MNSLIEKFKIYGFKRSVEFSFSELLKIIWTQKIQKSFSQAKEDIIIDTLLYNKKTGLYVDVGAYDPNRFSNTKRFYQKGWRGINVEPDVNNYKKFLKVRKRDINLNIGVGPRNAKLIFFRFFPDTLSTFSSESAKQYKEEGFRLVEKISIRVRRLEAVLKEYCKSKKIDFLSIDTEGYDVEVLKSNNWKKFRPRIICVETTIPNGTKEKRNLLVEKFLKKVGYKKYCDVGPNSIFLDVNR